MWFLIPLYTFHGLFVWGVTLNLYSMCSRGGMKNSPARKCGYTYSVCSRGGMKNHKRIVRVEKRTKNVLSFCNSFQ